MQPKPRPFRKSLSSLLRRSSESKNSLISNQHNLFFRREALKLSPIPQLESEDDHILQKKDSFERDLDEDSSAASLRRQLFDCMRLLLNSKEPKAKKPFIFARDCDDDSSSIEEKDEDKLDYVEYYEQKYEEFHNDYQDNLYTMKKAPFELLKYYGDPYVCLEFRKKLLFVKYLISFVSIKITSHPLFDHFMLVVILLNCIVFAMEDTKSQDLTLLTIDNSLIVVYSIEMMLKIWANGLFFSKSGYFRNGWNLLDFTIVITSYIPFVFTNQGKSFNLSSLRTLRVLRPLRTITSIKSLKVLMATLFSSIPLLMDTITVLLLFLNIFSISGLQMFAGVLKQKCFYAETGFIVSGEEIELLCGYQHCLEEGSICGKTIENPRWGVLNFDNYFYAFLMIFQCINIQGWSYILLCLIKTYSIYVSFYFIFIIFVGAFFLLNLTLAVIKAKFTDNASKRIEISNEALGRAEDQVDINELKVIKRLERTHYNRSKKRSTGGVMPMPLEMMKKRISIKGHGLNENELMGLSQRILEQKVKEKQSLPPAERRFPGKGISKAFPLSELIMKRMLKNNRKMLKDLFKIKQKPPDNYEAMKGTITIKREKPIKIIGMQHIYQEKGVKRGLNVKIDSYGGLKGLMTMRSKQSFFDHAEDFLNELQHHVPKDVIIKPDITLKSLKPIIPTTNCSSKVTIESPKATEIIEEEDTVRKELMEVTEDPEMVNLFNDAMFKHYYQEGAALAYPPAPRIQLFKNFSLDVKGQEQFWLKSPEAAKQSAMDKFLKNPNKPSEINIPGKKSIIFQKKLSMGSPGPAEYSPEKRLTLANLSQLFTQKKRNNLRDYKIMVDFHKPFKSLSAEDVLFERMLKNLEEKKKFELEKFKNANFTMVYNRRKKPKNFPLINNPRRGSFAVARRNKTMSFRDTNFTNKVTSMVADTNSELVQPVKYSFQLSPLKSGGVLSPRSRKKHLMSSVNQRPSQAILMTFDNIKKLIRERIQNEKRPPLKENEELYFNIIRKDLRDYSKSANHWSGDEILESTMTIGEYFGKFNRIFRALSTKNQDKRIWIPGLKGQLVILHKFIKSFVTSKIIENLLLLLVIFNTIILSLDGIFTDANTLELFQNLNLFFTFVFASELFLKVIAFSLEGYLRDKVNLFDATIVAISMAEIIFIESQNSTTIKTLKTLKAFRVLRVMRLLRSLKFMNMIIQVLSKTLASFIYIAILLVLFLFIYALLGMKLFGGEFNYPDKVYRQNFDSYNEAFLSVFQILSRSYWFYFLYLTFRSQINKIISALFLISWIFIGNLVFLNLFLAIMLDGFNQAQVDDKDDPTVDDCLKDEIEPLNPVPAHPTKASKFKSISSFDPNRSAEIEKFYQNVSCMNSFYIFAKRNALRLFFFKLTKSHYFEHFTLILIILNTVKMIVDTYIDPDSSPISGIFDEILTFAFVLEAIIKAIALGFCLDHGSYLRDTWNIWDFIIVVTSMVDVLTTGFSISIIQVFRLMRTLRPLRFVSHNVNMKIVVNSLLDSVTSIINVFIVILTVWLMFGILGISLLGGRMGHCDIESYYGVSRAMCEESGHEWKIAETNFDNIYYAMSTLFIIGSLEGWPDIMYKCIDSNTDDIGPIKDNYSFISYYFIAFILIGAFFLMNLFIGVMFFHFNLAQKQEKSKKNIFLTEDQAKWLDIQKMIAKARPDFKFNRRPNTKLQKYLDFVISSKFYDFYLSILYILSVLILMITYDTSPQSYKTLLEELNFAAIIMILIDFSLRLMTYGPVYYFYTNWTRLELFITICSLIDFLTILNALRVSLYVKQLMRMTRVLFLLKLIKRFKGINNLVETLIFSLPSLLNVGGLLVLIYLMYSILGVYLFKNISHGVVLDEYNNFHNFHLAMLILFKCSTGDEWFHVMFDLSEKAPGCEEDNSCGSFYAIIYFLSFFLICSYIMLNLFILIIIQQFEEYHLRDNNPIQTFRENLETFKKIWSEFSLASEGLNIFHRNLIEFYMKLPEPLGFGPTVPKTVIAKEIMNMNLSGDADGNIYFNELLFASMRRVFGAEVLKNAQSEIQMLLKREEYAIRKKIDKFKKKDIRKYSVMSSKISSKVTSRTSSFFSSFQKNMPEEFGFKKNIVNPIMEFLFVGMAFKSWKKFAILKQEKQLTIDDSLVVAEEDLSEEEEIKEEEEEDEKDSESESDDEASPIDNTPRIPFFQSNYILRNRARSIMVRGEDKEKKVGEENFMKNLKRRVSNLFMIKQLNVVHPE